MLLHQQHSPTPAAGIGRGKGILFLCTGLGRVNRGFEQYISGLAGQLRQAAIPGLPMEVWTGGTWQMEGIKSRRIAHFHRRHWLVANTAQPFLWEQRSFFVGMVPALLRHRPAAIYLGEYQLYCYLYKLRAALGLRFSLVLYTGGQAIPGLFDAQRDYVHHVTDAYLQECRHIPASRQWLLPHFIHEDFEYNPAAIAAIKQQASGKKIVLSVGLLDKQTKQMHLLIEAVSQLTEPVYLILLGEESDDTAGLQQQVQELGMSEHTMMQQVPHTQLGNWYKSADLFVLCSPKESFGLAMVEALYHGLPVVCMPFKEAKFVLQQEACYCPMDSAQQLADTLQHQLDSLPQLQAYAQRRTAFAVQHYGWPMLAPQYTAMMKTMAGFEAANNA